MSTWLDPLRRTLGEINRPVHFFFRDDDAGWHDERLFALLDILGEHGLPLDLAVIPKALTPALAEKLFRRIPDAHGPLGIHQHGYAHVNHEPEGRKWEFGPSRDYSLQRSDIEQGQSVLRRLFGPVVDPIFTPPWNRCTPVTVRCLVELGFQVLSREWEAEPFRVEPLQELPVRVDWFAHRKKVRLRREEWAASLAAAIAANDGPTGVMFHHAEMDAQEMNSVKEFMALLARDSNVGCHAMRALAGSKGGTLAPAS